ncbi:MAG: hypothetical protein IK034_03900 [Bacilli bacterium]|nr:hypothetical protein [Bacilli bacterium]
MRKTNLINSALASAMLMPLASSAPERMEANDWEGLYEMYKDFFKKTYEHTNMTVDFYGDGVMKEWTEQIHGSTSHIETNGEETWAWRNEVDTKIVGYQYYQGGHCYIANDKLYEKTYKSYIGRISILDKTNEQLQEGLTFEERSVVENSVFSAEKKDLGNNMTSLTCKIDTPAYLMDEENFDSCLFVFHAEAKDGLVIKVSYSSVFDDDQTTKNQSVFKITYNNVGKVRIPDIRDWNEGDYEEI